MVRPLRWGSAFLFMGAAALVCDQTDLAAQGRIGGHGSYQSELFGGAFGLGARAQLDLGSVLRGASLLGTFDSFFPDCPDCSLTEFGGNLLISGGTSFYFGAGAAFQRFERENESETIEDWIVNFIVGINIPWTDYVTPFVDARFETFGDATNQIVFSAGLMVGAETRVGPRWPAD